MLLSEHKSSKFWNAQILGRWEFLARVKMKMLKHNLSVTHEAENEPYAFQVNGSRYSTQLACLQKKRAGCFL
jgi:hypothetical protein